MLLDLAYVDALIREAVDPAGQILLRPFHNGPVRADLGYLHANGNRHQSADHPQHPLRRSAFLRVWSALTGAQPEVSCCPCA